MPLFSSPLSLARAILIAAIALSATPVLARPNMSDVTGPNMSDITGPNMSDVTGPNMSDVTGPNMSDTTGNNTFDEASIVKMSPQQLADRIGEVYAECGGSVCNELTPLLERAAVLLGEVNE